MDLQAFCPGVPWAIIKYFGELEILRYVIVSPCRDMLHSAKSTNFCKYITFTLLSKCLCCRMKWLHGSDLAHGLWFGDSYFIASVWWMEVIYYYVLYILTGSWFAHCQLTLPTSLRNILNIGSIHAKSHETAYGMKFLKLLMSRPMCPIALLIVTVSRICLLRHIQ